VVALQAAERREVIIAARYRAGETLQEISADYGITRERVRQILVSLNVRRRPQGARMNAHTNTIAPTAAPFAEARQSARKSAKMLPGARPFEADC
jgi:hypothetical protein